MSTFPATVKSVMAGIISDLLKSPIEFARHPTLESSGIETPTSYKIWKKIPTKQTPSYTGKLFLQIICLIFFDGCKSVLFSCPFFVACLHNI